MPSRPKDYNSPAWLELRDGVLARDGHRCRNCGFHEGLEVHHWQPLPDFQDHVDHLGYSRTGDPLVVHETGLITLCKECHGALTEVRARQGILRNPRLQATGRAVETKLSNVFQLWALGGERLPFKARKATWSTNVDQFYLIERIEISKWPYGFAWGCYCRNGEVGPSGKISGAGTYQWQAVVDSGSDAP